MSFLNLDDDGPIGALGNGVTGLRTMDKPDLSKIRTEIQSLASYGLTAGSELILKSDVLEILDDELAQHSSKWKAG